MSARSWDASEEDMVKRGDWRDSEAARTEAARSSQEKQKLVRGIMVEVRVGPTCLSHTRIYYMSSAKIKVRPHRGSNTGPHDLQSYALPLSYGVIGDHEHVPSKQPIHRNPSQTSSPDP